MKKFVKPEMEVISISKKDILLTSPPCGEDCNGFGCTTQYCNLQGCPEDDCPEFDGW